MEVDVHLATAPVGDELLILEENLKEAALMICDATDGRVKVSKFWLDASGYSSHEADIFVWPEGTFGKALVRGVDSPFTLGRNMRINMNHGPGLIGHELGHLLLGLKDQYKNTQQNAGCGLGYSMDRETFSPTVNSIMREYNSYCFDGQGEPSTPLESCNSSQECIDEGAGVRCAAIHDLRSELNTNPDFVPNASTTEFPGIRPGEELHLDGFFGAGVSTDPTAKDVGGQRLWYLNQDDLGQAREYWIEMSVWRQTDSGPYKLSAQLVSIDKDGEEKVTDTIFEANGVDAPELSLGFGAAHTCTLPGRLEARGLAVVNFSAPDDIQLVIPAQDLTDVAADVRLDVDLSQLCQDLSSHKSFEMIARSNPDKDSGIMTGSFIGASAWILNGADYLQLGDCQSHEDERFSRDRQQWISGEQWEHVASKADAAMAAYRKHLLPLLPDSCKATSDCSVGNVCVRGTCFAPLESCDQTDLWCGAHLLVDGNDWDLMRYNLKYGWPRFPDFAGGLELDVPKLIGLPEPDPAVSGCDLSDTSVEHSFVGVEQVVVLADRSGSMGGDWGTSSFTRFEHTARAIGAFANRLADSETQALFGVFNHWLGFTEGDFLTVVDADPGAGEIQVSYILDDLKSFDTVGSTAIGEALSLALDELARDGQAPSDAVFLVTDGIQTTGMEICEAAEKALEQRARIWLAPVNTEFPYEDFACVAETGGAMMAPRTFDETAGTLFEMQAKNQGQQLSLAYEKSALAHALNGFARKKIYKVPVEEGAEALIFQINPIAISSDSWQLEFKLFGPDGTVIPHTDPTFVEADSDQLGYGIRVPNPAPGLWKLKLIAPQLTKFTPESQVLMARIEHRGPKCGVHLSRSLVDDSDQDVKIMAHAKWGASIARGATYSAEVHGPDGTIIPVTMTPDGEGGAIGIVEDFAVDGTHVAQVQCHVSDEAELSGGEDENGVWISSNGGVRDGFERLELAPFRVELGTGLSID